MRVKRKSMKVLQEIRSACKHFRRIKYVICSFILLVLFTVCYLKGTNFVQDGGSATSIRFERVRKPYFTGSVTVTHQYGTICAPLSVKSKKEKPKQKGTSNNEQNMVIHVDQIRTLSLSNASSVSMGTTTINESPTAKQRLPQAIIIGMSKAGSRALNDYLLLNSNVRGNRKEVHFFDRDANYSKGYEWYKAQLAYSEQGQITIERTPGYVMSQKVPERIFKMNSSIKILLIVREPLTRAVSEYVHSAAGNVKRERKTFEQYALKNGSGEINTEYKPISKSVYFHHMPRWYRYFSQDQIYIVDGDNLIVNPVQELQKLERFLGVYPEITEDNVYFNKTKGFYCMKKLQSDIPVCLGKNKGRPHPSIKSEVIKKLHDFFRPLNEKFFLQIGRRFDWSY